MYTITQIGTSPYKKYPGHLVTLRKRSGKLRATLYSTNDILSPKPKVNDKRRIYYGLKLKVRINVACYFAKQNKRTRLLTEAKFLVPDWGIYVVDYGIG
jgi:hypothetical protein